MAKDSETNHSQTYKRPLSILRSGELRRRQTRKGRSDVRNRNIYNPWRSRGLEDKRLMRSQRVHSNRKMKELTGDTIAGLA